MTLPTQQLDRETEQYLAEILAQENITVDELLKTLIRDRWLSLQNSAAQNPATVSSRITASVTLPSTSADLKTPELKMPELRQKSQKQIIAEFMRKKRVLK